MKLEQINNETFSSFGTILALDAAGENPVFQIPVRVTNAPWRIAILKVLPQTITRLEAHPNSRESFEPVSGWAVLFAALPETPEKLHAFLLDRPVCLFEGIWHGILTLTGESVCKITENLEVEMRYLALEKELGVQAVFAGAKTDAANG